MALESSHVRTRRRRELASATSEPLPTCFFSHTTSWFIYTNLCNSNSRPQQPVPIPKHHIPPAHVITSTFFFNHIRRLSPWFRTQQKHPRQLRHGLSNFHSRHSQLFVFLQPHHPRSSKLQSRLLTPTPSNFLQHRHHNRSRRPEQQTLNSLHRTPFLFALSLQQPPTIPA